ncbi:TetR/AcrR family transcriptional regulator [Streptomyces sp. NBC_00258]|uniref:TetR/AcrR family transcriptional regulator n=1 Tax=Streptomyces sp. NBC_00258 TaxID=2903642 RepID=UPI002E290D89|nr:TetR family transcriptional regulator [Streptomyces sp. NBC_00258]
MDEVSPSSEPTKRGRGRPREVVRRPSGQGSPLQQRREDYPGTTRAILEAAHRVLLRHGTGGLTLVAVAREAHVDVTTVSYHFGTRHGLIENLMDLLYSDTVADLAENVSHLDSGYDRWHAYMATVSRMCQDREAARAYFDITALALRDDALRIRLARLNVWTIGAFAQLLQAPDLPDLSDDQVKVLGELIFAAVDGINLHHALAGSDYPLDDVLTLLERVISDSISKDTDTSHG